MSFLAQTVELLPTYPTAIPTATAIIEPTPIPEPTPAEDSHTLWLLGFWFLIAWLLGCAMAGAALKGRILHLQNRLALSNAMLHGTAPVAATRTWWNREEVD